MTAATAAYTAPREVAPRWLKRGDQVLMVPAAPDADVPYVAVWGEPVDPAAADARWVTVTRVDVDEDNEFVAVEMDDRFALEFGTHLDQVQARFPCEATP